MIDTRDPDVRETLAESAYLRDKAEIAAIAAEHSPDGAYYALAWECVSDIVKRPYRVAVAVALDSVG